MIAPRTRFFAQRTKPLCLEVAGDFACFTPKCVKQPYLGCREFTAHFRLIEEDGTDPPPVAEVDGDLGWMLYDMDFSNPPGPRPTYFHFNRHG